MAKLQELLKISAKRLDEINALLVDPKNETVTGLLKVVERYGGPQEINRKAAEAAKLENLMARLEKHRNVACGGGPVVAVMKAARALGADRSVVLKYGDSGDAGEHDKSHVVGYLSAALTVSR